MIKNLIVQSMECSEKRERLQIIVRTKAESEQEDDSMGEEEIKFDYSE